MFVFVSAIMKLMTRLLQVKQYADALHIPYGYYLIDSWWYGERDFGGVSLWEDTPSLLKYRFPSGLAALRDTLGVPLAAHIGKWVASTPYAQVESYEFIVDNASNTAIPQSASFWDDLFQKASDWDLIVVKQDHISEQIPDCDVLTKNISAASTWLIQQGEGVNRQGVSIQYCMDWPRVVLTSLQTPTSTHSRAGGDYLPDGAQSNWRVGVTSMFLWSIGLYPYKDTFYSTSTEVETNPNTPFCNFTEPYPFTHALVSALTAGPVAPSDGVGGSDAALIMRACRSDGVLLKPDRPAMAIDQRWAAECFGTDGPAFQDVWTTFTAYGNLSWFYIFGGDLGFSYNFYPSALPLPPPQPVEYLAYQLSNDSSGLVASVAPFSASSPIPLAEGTTYGDVALWVACPIFTMSSVVSTNSTQVSFMGETSKFIPISKQRISTVSASDSTLFFQVVSTSPAPTTVSERLLVSSSPYAIQHGVQLSSPNKV